MEKQSKSDITDKKPDASKLLAKCGTGISDNGSLSYTVRYKTDSKEFASFVAKHPITVDPSEGYDHPFLRTVSNYFLLSAYSAAVKNKDKIIDIASKYHHVTKWL